MGLWAETAMASRNGAGWSGLLIAGVLLLGGIVATALWWGRHEAAPSYLVPAGDCDLRSGPCAARLPSGEILTLAMTPRGIPAAEPLQVQVVLAAAEAAELQAVRRMQLDLVGVDMDMGFNRRDLSRQQAGVWGGQAILPVCVRQRMLWEARVLVERATGPEGAAFRFETLRP